MGHIKEPKGVDLVVGPSVLSDKDRKLISDAIEIYKTTGKMPAAKTRILSGKRSNPIKKRKVVSV